MVEREIAARVARDFEFLKERVLAVLIFGSVVDRGGSWKGRDTDICIVAPEGFDIKEVFRQVDVSGKRYDVWLFEELPLYMKMEVIERHEVVFCRGLLELHEYFYQFRKLWKDQKRRNEITKEDLRRMLRV